MVAAQMEQGRVADDKLKKQRSDHAWLIRP